MALTQAISTAEAIMAQGAHDDGHWAVRAGAAAQVLDYAMTAHMRRNGRLDSPLYLRASAYRDDLRRIAHVTGPLHDDFAAGRITSGAWRDGLTAVRAA